MSASVTSINEWGELVAKPGVNGQLVLVKRTIAESRLAILNVVQGVKKSAATDQVQRVIDGVRWALFTRVRADDEASQQTVIRTQANQASSVVAFVDGQPVMRNVFVRGPCQVLFVADVTAFGSIPANISHFIGGLVGFEVPATWEGSDRLLSLLSKP